MTINDEVEGLIEIASFHLLEQHKREWVEKAGQIIASHIRGRRVTEETQILLMQTQEQTEELLASEEEMRQGQEELQATQEEMERRLQEANVQAERREQEFLAQIEKLEQENQMLRQQNKTHDTI